MPSSKSSLDKRDVYYRKGKSDGYRARSAYKLLHLDEEFDLFRGVGTAVDLCAAPGSWSQVLSQRLKPASTSSRVVSVDLQPMAPLPGITTLQADITTPETVPRVLDALGGRKADLVVCDGAPDVTGVHDLDAYLHSQLLLAALTLSLTLMAPGATLVFKIFLSPLDPTAALLRSQLRAFFPGPPGVSSTTDHSESSDFSEFDDTRTDYDHGDDGNSCAPEATQSAWGPGYDSFGRPGGVWVRKPRSSRKGSGEAFILARNFDTGTLPLPTDFSPASLTALRQQIGATLTLESLAHLSTEAVPASDSWPATKAFVDGGNLNNGGTADRNTPSLSRNSSLSVSVAPHNRQASLASIDSAPSPVETDTLFGIPKTTSPTAASTNGLIRSPDPVLGYNNSRFRSSSDTMGPVSTPIPLPTPNLFEAAARTTRDFTSIASSPSANLYPVGFGTPHWHAFDGLAGGSHLLPQPGSPNLGSSLSAREREILASTPQYDGAVSPALSASSKTDAFFSTSQRDMLPIPPPALSTTLGRASSLGRGKPPVARARVVTTPATPIEGPNATSPTSPVFNPTPLRSVTGPGFDLAGTPSPPSGIANSRPAPPYLAPTVPGQLPRPVRPKAKSDPHYITREERHTDESCCPHHAGDILIPRPDDESLAIRSSADPGRWRLIKPLGQGAFASVWSAESDGPSQCEPESGIVAVKMVDRSTCDSNQRTAISFYREVEVLRHLVHPGIVGYIAHFSTSTSHCLVLEKIDGGELFSLLADDNNSARMIRAGPGDPDGYGFIRRVFGELCRAVAWLHEVEVVHRDIKLENILLTVNPFALPPTSSGGVPLDRLPVPLVKLSDFGLSRFIRSSSPLLSTRCGSEAYAAPEVVMGNLYDGRRTDAWALGVVLYALVAGELPFEDGAPLPPGRGRAGSTASVTSGDGVRDARRRTMHRIAKGEYGWREGVGTPGVKSVVARLLVRDPSRRAKVAQLWDGDWMRSGAGAVPPPSETMRAVVADVELVPEIPRRASDAPHLFVAGGLLVDHERIDQVALQDVAAL